MTDQLVKWLNKDVGLSRTVKAFEVDFANGYLFGELLNKHGLLADSEFADSFMDASTLSAKRNNLSKLKALLNSSEASNLGLRLKDEQIQHIMDEDRGTALRMLYQMRKKFLELPEDRLPQHKKDFLGRLQREPKGHHEERFFESSVKTLPRTAPRVVYELHKKGFVDEHTRQMQKASEDEVVKALATTQRQAEFNQSRQERMRTHKECVAEMETANEESWQANMRRKHTRLETDLNFEKKTIAREQVKIDKIRAAHQLDCGLEEGIQSHGIGWFEKNLQRIGIDTSEHAGRQAVPRSDGMGHEGIEATNAKELYDQMREMLPHAGQQKVECTSHMKRMKDTKKANDMAQRERDRRMRRQTVDNQGNQKQMESQRDEEDLLRWLQSETAGCRKEAAAYDLDQRYKVAVVNLRESVQNVCGQSLAVKTEEAWSKFAQKAREERAEKLEEREVKKQKEMMRGGLGLDALAADGDVEVSSDEGVDWENDPFGPAITAKDESAMIDETVNLMGARSARAESGNLLEPSQDAAPDSNVMPAKALIECAQDPRTSEYLFWRGEWGTHRPEATNVRAWLEELQSGSSQPVMTPEHQPQFGGLVRWFFAPEAPKVGNVELAVDYLPVVALTGNPIKYGNKGASLKAAQKVCAEFGFELVEPRTVVDECITLAQKEELGSDWPPIVRMAELGKIFLEESSKSADATIPQSLFAEMVFRKIELLSAPPPPPVLSEEEVAAQAKAKAKAKGKAEEVEEIVRPNGVLLHGYLAELGQHASWELALRGSTSSLLRINNGERDLQAQLSSMITSWTFAEVEARSYMDLPKVASAPPVQLLRLRHPSHAELCNKVISEAGNEQAWINGDFAPKSDAPQEDPKDKGKGKKPPAGKDAVEETATNEIPAVLCRGYEYESTHVDNPVDRAWLYEETQVFVDAFAGPLRNCQDVVPIIEAQGEEEESSEDALCRQVLEIVTALRQPAATAEAEAADADAEAAVEVPAEAPAEGEEAVPPVEAPVPEEDEANAEIDGANAETGVSVPWLALPAENQGWMRDSWLECMSSYISQAHGTLKEVHEESKTYNKGLVQMQRDFLTFLQGTDEKTNLMEDFLQTWPARFSRRQPDDINEEVEDLSDRLWSFADCRRAVSVEEHLRLFRSGFWEGHAITCLSLAAELHRIECTRYTVAAQLLATGYGFLDAYSAGGFETDVCSGAAQNLIDVSPGGLSSIAELSSWISSFTERIATAPLPLPSSAGEIQETSEKPEVAALCAALGAEKVELVQRLRTIEAWTMARLQEMRDQHDEAFARMDDWIRDRVRVENDAIKAAIAQVLDCSWNEEEDPASLGNSRSMRSQNSTLPRQNSSMKTPAKSPKTSPSPTGGLMRRKRREVLKSLYPGTLDVAVLQPPSLEVVLARSIRPANDSLTSCWTQDMLVGLVQTICKRSPGIAAIGVDALLAAVLERRSSGFKFDIDVVPPAWVLRSEAALATFCSAWVSPAWGNIAVDVTDLLLHLTFHERNISWPSAEALMASREMLESTASGLSEEELTAYPDVPVSEELFMKLPLWDDSVQAQLRDQPLTERLGAIKGWIFRILLCFQDEAMPVLPSFDGQLGTATISARRIFTYLGLGATPMAGLQQSMKLMISPIPPKEVAEGEESAPKILVQDLWAILFSCRSRPTGAAMPPPELADFCTDLLAPDVDADLEPPMSAGKPTKPGKPGKGAVPDPEPVVEEKAPPPLPEEMTVAFDDKLVRNKAVLRALCTHGGLLCRRRALAVLFPAAGQLHDTAAAADARGLATLVPTAEPPQEDAPEAEA